MLRVYLKTRMIFFNFQHTFSSFFNLFKACFYIPTFTAIGTLSFTFLAISSLCLTFSTLSTISILAQKGGGWQFQGLFLPASATEPFGLRLPFCFCCNSSKWRWRWWGRRRSWSRGGREWARRSSSERLQSTSILKARSFVVISDPLPRILSIFF